MKLQMKPHPYEGKLITFCGLDGCGKTTLIARLKQYLLTYEIPLLLTKQPTNSVRSSEIFRTYMDTPEHEAFDYRSLSLFAASDRIQHTSKVIEPALQEGKVVISDRYFYSCLANLRARGYKEDQWIYEIGSYMARPDVAFFLDIDVDTAIERVRRRPEERDRFIDVELQYKLRQQYLNIAADVGGIVITTNRPAEDCFKQVLQALLPVMQNS